jgi:hypothetical protein
MGLLTVHTASKLGERSGRRSAEDERDDDMFVLGSLVLALPIARLVAAP